MPDPTKQIFPVEDPPSDWAARTDTQKIKWFNTQGLKSDPTINLGDCYRSAVKLTHIASILFKAIRPIGDIAKARQSPKLRQYLSAFLNALHAGLGHLSNYIYTHINTLLETGAFANDAPKLTPLLPLPDVPTVAEGQQAGGQPAVDSFWAVLNQVLKVLTDSWPWLGEVRGHVTESYSQRFAATIDAGQAFFDEYRKFQVGDT